MADATIPRPDISVAQIILMVLAQTGRASFRQIQHHPSIRLLGAERSENSFYTALARLKRRHSVVRRPDHSYELTPTGEYSALKAHVRRAFTEQERESDTSKNTTGSRPNKWDGRWRIVLFDVPEQKRPVRDYLRGVLKRQGFYEFQRSMWVSPHRLPAFLQKLLADPHMRPYARIMTTYDIDYDEDLRKRFRLE